MSGPREMISEIWLGLDIGERRIGVAKSDMLGVTAQPLSVIERSGLTKDIERLAVLAEQEGATGFVVGLPLRTDGSHGPEVDTVKGVAAELSARTELPIEWIDERFTTVLANRSLREQGVKGPARRQRVDQVAAALILQAFLDRRQHRAT